MMRLTPAHKEAIVAMIAASATNRRERAERFGAAFTGAVRRWGLPLANRLRAIARRCGRVWRCPAQD